MIQFEYDMHYKIQDLNIDDMFNKLEGWYFFHVTPNGLSEVTKSTLIHDHVYTNIFASREYPTQIIKDFRQLIYDNCFYTVNIQQTILDIFWELPETFIVPVVPLNTNLVRIYPLKNYQICKSDITHNIYGMGMLNSRRIFVETRMNVS